MTSVHSSVDADEVDLSGLVESIVDSDEEEDLAESMDVSCDLELKCSFSVSSLIFLFSYLSFSCIHRA